MYGLSHNRACNSLCALASNRITIWGIWWRHNILFCPNCTKCVSFAISSNQNSIQVTWTPHNACYSSAGGSSPTHWYSMLCQNIGTQTILILPNQFLFIHFFFQFKTFCLNSFISYHLKWSTWMPPHIAPHSQYLGNCKKLFEDPVLEHTFCNKLLQ